MEAKSETLFLCVLLCFLICVAVLYSGVVLTSFLQLCFSDLLCCFTNFGFCNFGCCVCYKLLSCFLASQLCFEICHQPFVICWHVRLCLCFLISLWHFRATVVS